MFGISGQELVIIAIVALFLFGPDKIPEVIKTAKKALSMYTEARDQVTEVVNSQILSPEEAELLKDPLGLNKIKGSVDSILTPERLNLISQTPNKAASGATGSAGVSAGTANGSAATDAHSIWASVSGESSKEDGSAG